MSGTFPSMPSIRIPLHYRRKGISTAELGCGRKDLAPAFAHIAARSDRRRQAIARYARRSGSVEPVRTAWMDLAPYSRTHTRPCQFLPGIGPTLLAGDAFCTTKPESFFEANFIQHPELHGPPAYFTSDWSAANNSVEKLASLMPVTVAPGHGKPLAGANVASSLAELAARFKNVALPANVR